MRSALAIVLTVALVSSGCATGYGALAGGGAVAMVALIGTAASGRGADLPPATAGGFLIGALAGAVGGAVAGAVVRGRERRAAEDMRTELYMQRQRDQQTFEDRLQRLEAVRDSSAKSEPNDRQKDVAKPGRDAPEKMEASELSPRVREFSAD